MKILTFAASSSRNSINKKLVQHAGERLRTTVLPSAELVSLQLEDYDMPVYSIDREKEQGILPPARRFFEMIGAVDALIVSYAEHNGCYTAAFKNVFDWASRIDAKVFQGKPMVLLATSPGGRGAKRVLETAVELAPYAGGEVLGSLSVPKFGANFDVERGLLTDSGLSSQLDTVLASLAERLNSNGRA